LITSYASPKYRKFPSVVLVWTCAADLMLAVYSAMQWMQGPLRIPFALAVPGSSVCIFKIYVEMFLELQCGVVCILVSYTLYATIVQNVDFNFFTCYYYWFVAGRWGFPLLFPLLSLVGLNSPTVTGYCCLNTTQIIMLRVVPWAVMSTIQLWFIVELLRHVCIIQSAIQSFTTNHSTGQAWLLVRLITFEEVIFYHFGSICVKEVFAILPVLLSINSFVILFANTDLREFISVQFNRLSVAMRTCISAMKWKRTQITPSTSSTISLV
jgi:hypothetical protein